MQSVMTNHAVKASHCKDQCAGYMRNCYARHMSAQLLLSLRSIKICSSQVYYGLISMAFLLCLAIFTATFVIARMALAYHNMSRVYQFVHDMSRALYEHTWY